MKFKICVKIVSTFEEWLLTETMREPTEGREGESVLHFDLYGGYRGIYTYKKFIELSILKLCTLL